MARSKLAEDLSDTSGSTAFAGPSAGRVPRAPAAGQSTTLTLRPLLAPFKGRGRLFLRIEKMPQRATLSAGKRNSDGSWSLASDELDDVTYQVPPQAAGDHVLTIRVTALDGGEATTLKVLDFPISFSTAAAPIANETGRDQPANLAASQLGHLQSLFALREAEMGLLQATLEQEQRERARDAELIHQRLQSDFDRRFDEAAAQHRQELEATRAALQSQIADLTSRIPAQREKERDAELLGQRLQQEFDQRFDKAAARHQQELEATRAALQAEITEVTARADASERRRREERQSREAYAAERVAQIEQALRATHEQELEAARRRQEALSQQQLEDIRRAAAADGEANLRSAQDRWNADLARAVQQARGDWDKEQDERIGKLQEQHERHCNDLVAAEREKIAMLELAQATPREDGPDHNAAALESLKDQLAAASRVLADRERELESAKAQLEKERTENGGQADRLLQQERGNWRSLEDSLRQQLSALQTQAEAQIASLTARCREAETRSSRNSWGTAVQDKARIDALNLEIASLRTALAKQAHGPAQDRSNSAYQTASRQDEQQAGGRSKMSLLRDFSIAVCCITPLILFYPQVKSFVTEFMSDDTPASIVAAKPASPQAVAKARMATVLRGVNMRQTASAKADVVFTLKKGASVEILSTSGKWIEVGVKGARGWIYSTYLHADGAP